MNDQTALQEELAPWRAQIDALDDEIVQKLNQRAKIAQEIGKIKARLNAGQSAYTAAREAQVLNHVTQKNQGPFKDENLRQIYKEIMSATLALERPNSVAFLGPWGTFTESAARYHFGHAAQFFPENSIESVFKLAETNQTDYAVVPIENSAEGSVARTLDLLMETPLKIVGEVILRISHNLFSNAQHLSDIHTIYAHAQAFAQCRIWLCENLPNAKQIPVESNASAVLKAQNEKNAAAIAGKTASNHYDVAILAKGIESSRQNSTRFFVLGKENVPPSQKDKTSLIMAAPNRTGALHEMLLPFSACGISMTHLESRPIANALWQYVFFVDVEGHQNDFSLAAALKELQRRAAYLKILGSYPAFI